VGIGLHFGHLELGIVGETGRWDSSIISDAVNTAARVEGLTKGFGARILVSEALRERLDATTGARLRRIGPDGATAVVLAGFFGLGAVLFSIVQGHPAGSQGGLRTLLFGSAAAMGRAEVVALLALATVTLALLIVFLRGLTVVAFDEDFARSAGLPVRGLDLLLTVLLVATVVAGMQMAGIVLVVAMVITPAAAARNLGGRIGSVTAIAAILGAVTAAAGVIASRAVAGVPTGAAMTLAATAAFVVTVPFGHLARGARA
jgi:manganese/zinc/iron transport system permease protein